MELRFEKEELSYVLQTVLSVANKKHPLPILGNTLINASNGVIECSVTDLEIDITIRLIGDILEEGAVAVSAKKLSDIVKELPNDEDVILKSSENNRVLIQCGRGNYRIIGLPKEDFPELSYPQENAITLEGDVLRSVIYKTEFSAAEGEEKGHLNGICFNSLDNRTEVVATDGSRNLAVAHCMPINSSVDSKKLIIPLKSAREIAKVFDESPSVDISLDRGKIIISDGDIKLGSRLIEAEYPAYEGLLRIELDSHVVVNKLMLLQAVRRVSILANPKNYAVKLKINSKEIEISAKTPELGDADEVVTVDSGEGEVEIGVDSRALIDTLSRIDTKIVRIDFKDSLTQISFRPLEDGHICLIMAMKLETIHEASESPV